MRKITRERILNKFNYKCAYCASNEFLEVDHIIPLSKGGKDDEENLQILCRKCNRAKSNKLEAQLLKNYIVLDEKQNCIYIKSDIKEKFQLTGMELISIINQAFKALDNGTNFIHKV